MAIKPWTHGDPPNPTLGDDFNHAGDEPPTKVEQLSDAKVSVGELVFIAHKHSTLKTLMRVTESDIDSGKWTAELASIDDAKSVDPDNPPKEIVI